MRHPLKQLGRIVAIVVLGSFVAEAAETPGFDAQFKIRGGIAVGTRKDDLSRRSIGFGLDLGFDPGFGRFGFELGYQYITGNQYKSDVSTFPVAAGEPAPDPKFSGDIRRNSLQGITGRFSFSRSFANSDFGYRVGLQLGGAKFRHEYLGDIGDTNWATYEDTYNGTPTKSTMAISPFVGMSYKLNESSIVELNVVLVSYTAINYVHVAGQNTDGLNSTALDYLTEQKRHVPHIELGYAFRF